MLPTLLALTAVLQVPPSAADLKLGFPLFVAYSTDPTPKAGTLAKLTSDYSVTIVQPDATVPAGELVSLRRAEKPQPALPAARHVRLANGDVLRATDLTADGDLSVTVGVRFGSARASQPLVLPLTALSVIWFTDPPADTPSDPAAYSWFDATKKQDALLLKNGDVVRGAVDKLTGDDTGVVRFKPAGEKAPTSYPRSAVAALAFDPSLARVKKPKGAFARVTTADGSRVSVSAVSSDEKLVEMTTLTGGKLTVSVADLMAVDVFGGKATYLSDLKPKGVKEEAFGAVAWPWAADRTAKGNPLRLKTALGEEVFGKGLGLHPKTTLTYDLGGKYKRFEATVGLDATTGSRGAVDVTVLIDGKPQKLDGLTFAAGVKGLSLDVTKAKELTIVVDFGPGGDVQDDVNLVDARLVE
jgi:hypothetical protein